MLCFFDTAREHEEECRDARVEDVRTFMHMARYYCTHTNRTPVCLFVFLIASYSTWFLFLG